MKYFTLVFLFFVALLTASSSSFGLDVVVKKSGNYELPWAESMVFDSSVNGKKYELYVRLPSSYYEESAVKRKYPVTYVLDGQWHFALAQAIESNLNYDEDIAESIVVGVSWGFDPNKLRKDRIDDLGVGAKDGYMLFKNVLQREIVGFIDRSYRASGERYIIGSSLSASYVLYLYLSEDSLFNGFVASSPTAINYSVYRTMVSRQDDRQINLKALFVSFGENETVERESKKIIDAISREFPKNVGTEILGGVGHASANALSFTAGLKYVMNRKVN